MFHKRFELLKTLSKVDGQNEFEKNINGQKCIQYVWTGFQSLDNIPICTNNIISNNNY